MNVGFGTQKGENKVDIEEGTVVNVVNRVSPTEAGPGTSSTTQAPEAGRRDVKFVPQSTNYLKKVPSFTWKGFYDHGASPESEEQDVLPLFPGSAGAPTPTCALEAKLNQLISEVNQLNGFMGTVARYVAGFEDRIISIENCLQDQSRRMETHDSRQKYNIQRLNGHDSSLKYHTRRQEIYENSLKVYNCRLEEHDSSVKDQNRRLEDYNNGMADHTCRLYGQESILKEHNRRLEELDSSLKVNNNRVKGHDIRLKNHDRRLESHENCLGDLNSRLEGHDKGLTDDERRLEQHDSSLKEHSRRLESYNTNLKEHNIRLEGHDTILKGHNLKLQIHDSSLKHHNQKLEDHDSCLKDHSRSLECQNTNNEELKSRMFISVEREEREELVIKLVDYTYRREEPSVDETMYLIPVVKRLNMNNLVKKLVDVLTNALAVANCIAIFQLASQYQLKDLRAAAHLMMCRNFNEVSKTCSDFCNLSLTELRELIFSNSMNATQEQVLEAIERWIEADRPVRRHLMSQLLPTVKVHKRSFRFQRQVQQRYVVQDDQTLQPAAKDWIQRQSSGGLGDDRFQRRGKQRYVVQDDQTLQPATRDGIKKHSSAEPSQDNYGTEKSARSREFLFVMGGLSNVDTVETLDPSRGSWVSHKIADAPSKGTWIYSWGRNVLVLERDNRRFRSFDVQTREWTKLRDLPQHREYFAVTGSGDHVYVLGGEEPHSNRCDSYDARTDQWGVMPQMQKGRMFAACVCEAGIVYCSGGQAVPGLGYLSSVEILNTRGEKKWSYIPPMAVGRCYHCLVGCGRFLWAIGGTARHSILSVVERYDVEKRQWNHVRPLLMPISGSSASVFDGRIHVIGGVTKGLNPVSTVAVYDEDKDQWTTATALQDARLCHGSSVVRSLSHADAVQYAVSIK